MLVYRLLDESVDTEQPPVAAQAEKFNGSSALRKRRAHLVELMRQVGGSKGVASAVVRQDSPVGSLKGALHI